MNKRWSDGPLIDSARYHADAGRPDLPAVVLEGSPRPAPHGEGGGEVIIVSTTMLAIVIGFMALGAAFGLIKKPTSQLVAVMCFSLGVAFTLVALFGNDFEKNRAIEAALVGEVEDAVCYPEGCSLLIKASNGESRWTWAPLEDEAVREEAGR